MRMKLAALLGAMAIAGLTALAQETAPPDAAETAPENPAGEAPACPPLLDEDGQPVVDAAGQQIYDTSGLPIRNPDGEPVLDEAGEPRTESCRVPDAASGGEGATDTAEADDTAATPGPLAPLLRLLDAGGPVIVILAILAVLALAVGLVKLIQFIWLGVGRAGFVSDAMDKLLNGEGESALSRLEHRRSPVARVMAAALRGKSSTEMNDDLVREETTRVAQSQLDGLERGLSLLSLIATIAPLLGLLGTVLGMIEAFQQMETVGDRVEPAVLAGGIWEALLTTAAGLSVAIPAAVLFTWLQRAVDVEGQRMEDAATQVFTGPLYRAARAAA